MKKFNYKGFSVELKKTQFRRDYKVYFKWIMKNKQRSVSIATNLFFKRDEEKYKNICIKWIDKYYLREVARKI